MAKSSSYYTHKATRLLMKKPPLYNRGGLLECQ